MEDNDEQVSELLEAGDILRLVNEWHSASGAVEVQEPTDERTLKVPTDNGGTYLFESDADLVDQLVSALRSETTDVVIGSRSSPGDGSPEGPVIVAVMSSESLAFIGRCTTEALLVPIEASNSNPREAFEAANGKTGDELVRSLLGIEDSDEVDEPGVTAPNQVIPGLGVEPTDDLVETFVFIDSSVGTFPSGGGVCARTSAGWSVCLDISGRYSGTPSSFSVFGAPGDPIQLFYTADPFLEDVQEIAVEPPMISKDGGEQFLVVLPQYEQIDSVVSESIDCGPRDPALLPQDQCTTAAATTVRAP